MEELRQSTRIIEQAIKRLPDGPVNVDDHRVILPPKSRALSLSVGESSRREEVLEWMREQEFNLDQLDTIVLLDSSAQFSGAVPVARLLLAASDQRMAELKMDPLLSLPPNANDKEVFELFDKYNLRMLTVVDQENRPIGVITVDDVVSKLLKD